MDNLFWTSAELFIGGVVIAIERARKVPAWVQLGSLGVIGMIVSVVYWLTTNQVPQGVWAAMKDMFLFLMPMAALAVLMYPQLKERKRIVLLETQVGQLETQVGQLSAAKEKQEPEGISGEPVGVLWPYKKVTELRSVDFILNHAQHGAHSVVGLPDILIIGTSCSNWVQKFTEEHYAPELKNLLSQPHRQLLSIGILFGVPQEGTQARMIATDAKVDDLLEVTKEKRERLLGRLDYFSAFGDRIQVRVLDSAIIDSLCLYNLGAPHSPTVTMNVHKDWKVNPEVALNVEDAGEQRVLYQQLLSRSIRWWGLGKPCWPPIGNS